MCPSFTVLKKRNYCYSSSKRVANKKNIEQRLETNIALKIYLQQIKMKGDLMHINLFATF